MKPCYIFTLACVVFLILLFVNTTYEGLLNTNALNPLFVNDMYSMCAQTSDTPVQIFNAFKNIQNNSSSVQAINACYNNNNKLMCLRNVYNTKNIVKQNMDTLPQCIQVFNSNVNNAANYNANNAAKYNANNAANYNANNAAKYNANNAANYNANNAAKYNANNAANYNANNAAKYNANNAAKYNANNY